MADASQLNLLHKGVRGWNQKWNPGSRRIGSMEPTGEGPSLYKPKNWGAFEEERRLENPDLSGADLRELNLAGINLQGADLRGASLKGANLYKANLWEADLTGADLRGTSLDQAQMADASLVDANLSSANLAGILLARTDLSQANLADANVFSATVFDADFTRTRLNRSHLIQARFSRTMFHGTDFTQAKLGSNVFGSCTFRGVIGLSECEHRFGSYLEPMTLAGSDPLPTSFFRGCGWPDDLIAAIPKIVANTDQLTSCFISYSNIDIELARRLHKDLSDHGVRCWFAPENLRSGDRIRYQIDESIHQHDKLLLILSEASIESSWVEKEVETALDLERSEKRTVLFPIRLDDAVLGVAKGWVADIRRTRHIGDFRDWKSISGFDAAFARLLRELKNSMPSGPATRKK